MQFVYGAIWGNSAVGRRVYMDQFLNRKVPDREIFEAVHQHFRESGQLVNTTKVRPVHQNEYV